MLEVWQKIEMQCCAVRKIAFQVLLSTSPKTLTRKVIIIVGIINEKAFNKPKLNCNRLEPQTDDSEVKSIVTKLSSKMK